MQRIMFTILDANQHTPAAPGEAEVIGVGDDVPTFAQFSGVKHLKEVSSLSRPAMLSMEMTQPVSVPLQSGIPLMSAPPSAHLAMRFPLWGAIRIYPVPLE